MWISTEYAFMEWCNWFFLHELNLSIAHKWGLMGCVLTFYSVRSEPWRLTETEIMHTQICICHWALERHLLSCRCDTLHLCGVKHQAWARWGSHTRDTETQLDYTLCLSSAITHAVHMASQQWTEASHCCDISSGLNVNESLIEMQTHSLYS